MAGVVVFVIHGLRFDHSAPGIILCRISGRTWMKKTNTYRVRAYASDNCSHRRDQYEY